MGCDMHSVPTHNGDRSAVASYRINTSPQIHFPQQFNGFENVPTGKLAHAVSCSRGPSKGGFEHESNMPHRSYSLHE
jgi:hypothetical protein